MKSITFGIERTSTLIEILDFGHCGDFEIAGPQWPDNGYGTAVSWDSPQSGSLVDVYWFAAAKYYGGGQYALSVVPHPSQGGYFADDSVPAFLDPIVDYGSIGFGSAGFAPCPEPPGPGGVDPWWLEPDTQAEYVILTSDALWFHARSLADRIHLRRQIKVALMTTTQIADEFGNGSVSSSDIVEALQYAYETWKSAPQFVLLLGDADESDPGGEFDHIPTVYRQYEPSTPGDNVYEEDQSYGDLWTDTANSAEILVGRVPARTLLDVGLYYHKLGNYDSRTGSNTVVFVVGDANINGNNSDRQAAAEEIMEEIAEGGLLTTADLFASDYDVGGQAGRTEALNDLQTLVSSSPSLIEFMGNNTGVYNVAHAFFFAPNTTQPVFPVEDLDNVEGLPIAFFSTCLNAGFAYESQSPAEQFLLATDGAATCIGRSGISAFEANEKIIQEVYRSLRPGLSIGELYSSALKSFLDARAFEWHDYWAARMTNVLGDPSMPVRLAESTPRQFIGSFETWTSHVRQNVIDLASSDGVDTLNTSGRIVHVGHAPLCNGIEFDSSPIDGDRAFRACAKFEAGPLSGGGSLSSVATWILSKQPLVITGPNPVLSFWAQDLSTAEDSQIAVDLRRDGVSLLEGFEDQYGLPMEVDSREYTRSGEWEHFFVRLDPLIGESVSEIVLSVAGAPNEWRTVDIDRLFVGSMNGDSPNDWVIDGTLNGDENEDGSPDYWNDAYPNHQERCLAIYLEDGVYLDATELYDGISQALPVCGTIPSCSQLTVVGRGLDTGSKLAIRVREIGSGDIIDDGEWTWNAAPGQATLTVECGGGDPLFIEIVAATNRVIVESVSATICTTSETLEENDNRELPQLLQIFPNPVAYGSLVHLAGRSGIGAWRIHSVDGRQVASGSTVVDGQSTAVKLPPRVTAGRYILRVQTTDGWYASPLIVK